MARAPSPATNGASSRRSRLPGLVAVGCFLLLWQGASSAGLVPRDLLPGPIAVGGAFVRVARLGYRGTTLPGDALITVLRCLAGFFLAVALGIPLGLWMGLEARARAAFDYIIQFFRPLPPLSYLMLLILWFGTGEASKIVLLFLTAFPIVVSATMAGVRSVPALRIQAAEMLGVPRGRILWHVILPSAAPLIVTGLKIALAAAFSTVVAAEFVAADSGLGWMVLSASRFLQNATVMMGIVLLGLIGMALSLALDRLDRRLIHWRRMG